MTAHHLHGIQGCGLGLRREFVKEMAQLPADQRPGWFEIVPENWVRMLRKYRDAFETIADSSPLVAHGLSLSVGSPNGPDRSFLQEIKTFLDTYGIVHYSEHLSFSNVEGAQSYELLPLPLTPQIVDEVVERIRIVSDILERPLIIENATYYFVPKADMQEVDFITQVLEKSGAKLLLDVNNVYVNSKNHHFDPYAFIDAMSMDQVAYLHIAGHWCREDDWVIDTHGMPVCEGVWELLAHTLSKRNFPVLLERDNNIPPFEEMMGEFSDLENRYTQMIKHVA